MRWTEPLNHPRAGYLGQVTRHGSADDPAYVIEQDDGTIVLKLRSEVERA